MDISSASREKARKQRQRWGKSWGRRERWIRRKTSNKKTKREKRKIVKEEEEEGEIGFSKGGLEDAFGWQIAIRDDGEEGEKGNEIVFSRDSDFCSRIERNEGKNSFFFFFLPSLRTSHSWAATNDISRDLL